MVSLSNTSFLLSHIRNCFVTGDDTGICELLVDREIVTPLEVEAMLSDEGNPLPIINTEEENFPRLSPEISVSDNRGIRTKSMTENRLMEINIQKQKQKATQCIVTSNSPPRQLSATEIETLFPLRHNDPAPPIGESATRPRLTSALSRLLAESANLPRNPFQDFAMYDAAGAAPEDLSTSRLRQIRVFLWDLPVPQRSTPVAVIASLETSVAQFIGLTLWLYTNQERKPDINSSQMDRWEVYMFEDLDDLDTDFPPMAKQDPIYRYEFEAVALVDVTKRPGSNKEIAADSLPDSDLPVEMIFVTIHMAQGNSVQQFARDTKLAQVLSRSMKKRNLRAHDGYEYRLERRSQPGQPVNLDTTLEEIGETQFILVRDNSRRDPIIIEKSEESEPQPLAKLLESLQLRQYKVSSSRGVFTKEILLSVSEEKVELEQHSGRTLRFGHKKPPTSWPINSVADCSLVTSSHSIPSSISALSSNSKASFRLTTLPRGVGGTDATDAATAAALQDMSGDIGEFRVHVFETTAANARDICEQINCVLDYRGSRVRQTFLEREARRNVKK